MNNPAAVRQRVHDRLELKLDQDWVTQLVMYEVDEFWRRIQKVKDKMRLDQLRKQVEKEEAEKAQKEATEA